MLISEMQDKDIVSLCSDDPTKCLTGYRLHSKAIAQSYDDKSVVRSWLAAILEPMKKDADGTWLRDWVDPIIVVPINKVVTLIVRV